MTKRILRKKQKALRRKEIRESEKLSLQRDFEDSGGILFYEIPLDTISDFGIPFTDVASRLTNHYIEFSDGVHGAGIHNQLSNIPKVTGQAYIHPGFSFDDVKSLLERSCEKFGGGFYWKSIDGVHRGTPLEIHATLGRNTKQIKTVTGYHYA